MNDRYQAFVTQKRLMRVLLVVAVGAMFLSSSSPSSSQRGLQTTTNTPIAIDHVALNVADLDASVAFYAGVFGFQEIPAAAKGRRWLSLGKGVALHLLGGRTQPVVDNRSVHLALTSDNLEPIMQRLRERKVTWSDFAGTPGTVSTTRTDGVRQIFFRDPDGYWIEVNDALKNTKGN